VAFKIGDAWGIGGPNQINGLLILVSKNDHDVFIATGKGMEGVVPDVTAKRIVDNIIIPTSGMKHIIKDWMKRLMQSSNWPPPIRG
jgi:uncharacterized protein